MPPLFSILDSETFHSFQHWKSCFFCSSASYSFKQIQKSKTHAYVIKERSMTFVLLPKLIFFKHSRLDVRCEQRWASDLWSCCHWGTVPASGSGVLYAIHGCNSYGWNSGLQCHLSGIEIVPLPNRSCSSPHVFSGDGN